MRKLKNAPKKSRSNAGVTVPVYSYPELVKLFRTDSIQRRYAYIFE